MADQAADPSKTETPMQTAPALESLHPSEIKIRAYTTPEARKIAEDKIEAWYSQIAEDVRLVLRNHGVDAYELCFLQKGSKALLLTHSDELFVAAKLAAAASRSLKKQINEELNDD